MSSSKWLGGVVVATSWRRSCTYLACMHNQKFAHKPLKTCLRKYAFICQRCFLPFNSYSDDCNSILITLVVLTHNFPCLNCACLLGTLLPRIIFFQGLLQDYCLKRKVVQHSDPPWHLYKTNPVSKKHNSQCYWIMPLSHSWKYTLEVLDRSFLERCPNATKTADFGNFYHTSSDSSMLCRY